MQPGTTECVELITAEEDWLVRDHGRLRSGVQICVGDVMLVLRLSNRSFISDSYNDDSSDNNNNNNNNNHNNNNHNNKNNDEQC